jgi:hypothetical protein
MPKIEVEGAFVSEGSTIGYIFGRPVDDHTKRVYVAGDARMTAEIGEAIITSDEPVIAEYEWWQVVEVRELPQG